MKKTTWVMVALVIVALIAGLFIYITRPVSQPKVGAAGNLLAENYDSYIIQNGGFNTAKPIKTASTLDVAGATTFTGGVTDTGGLNENTYVTAPAGIFGFMVQGNSATIDNISTSSSSYSLSPLEACTYDVFNITPLGSALTVTLPTLASTTAVCPSVTGVGQMSQAIINVFSTSTTIAAGAGSSISYSSSTTIAAGKSALLTILATTTSSYRGYLVNLPN